MNGKQSGDELYIGVKGDGLERRCDGCGRIHVAALMQKRCGACFDEGKNVIFECNNCGGALELDKLMAEHDASVHSPTPIYPVKPPKTVEEWAQEFRELIPGSDGPMWGVTAGGKVTAG